MPTSQMPTVYSRPQSRGSRNDQSSGTVLFPLSPGLPPPTGVPHVPGLGNAQPYKQYHDSYVPPSTPARTEASTAIRERSESNRNIAPSLKASYDYNPRGYKCDSPEDNTTSSLFTRGSPDDKFVVYKGGDGLLNKLYEAQLFIQQAVAENSALRNYVYVLRAIYHWRRTVDTEARRKQLLKRGVLSWSKSMLFKAWRPWCAHIKRRAVLSRIILRWQNRHLKLGFEKWLHVLNQNRQEEKQREMVMQLVAYKWVKNMLFKAWRPWCAQIKRRAVLSRIILRWQNKHLKLGFEKWLHVLNQNRQEEKQRERVIQLVAHKWTKNILGTALSSWSMIVQLENKEKRGQSLDNKLRGYIVRWRMRILFKALKQWRVTVHKDAKLKSILRRVVIRWIRALLWRALATWSARVGHQLFLRETCRRIIITGLQRDLGRAFRGWMHNCNCSSKVSLQNLCNQVMRSQMLAPYFSSWRDHLNYQVLLRRTGLLIYFRSHTMLLRNVLRCLRDRVQYKHYMKVLQGRMNRRFLRLERTWTSNILENGFRRWKHIRMHLQYKHQFVRGILNRLRRIRSHDILLLWRVYCKRVSRLAHVQTVILVRWRMFELFRALRAWNESIRSMTGLHSDKALNNHLRDLSQMYITYVPGLQDSEAPDSQSSRGIKSNQEKSNFYCL